jgi:two-component system response regulator MtrA
MVDDDKPILESTSTILRGEGYVVDTAQTGKEALEKLEKGSYVLVMVNLRLPDMDGTELLPRIRDTNPQAVKIVLTGAPQERASQIIEMGADEYLTKPINPDALMEKLRAKLGEASKDEQ